MPVTRAQIAEVLGYAGGLATLMGVGWTVYEAQQEWRRQRILVAREMSRDMHKSCQFHLSRRVIEYVRGEGPKKALVFGPCTSRGVKKITLSVDHIEAAVSESSLEDEVADTYVTSLFKRVVEKRFTKDSKSTTQSAKEVKAKHQAKCQAEAATIRDALQGWSDELADMYEAVTTEPPLADEEWLKKAVVSAKDDALVKACNPDGKVRPSIAAPKAGEPPRKATASHVLDYMDRHQGGKVRALAERWNQKFPPLP